MLFDGNSRTALSFNTNENGTIDIYLSGPYVFTRVDVYAGSGPAAPKDIQVYAVHNEALELLASWTKPNEIGWSESPSFSMQATHFRIVFANSYDDSFNYIRISQIRLHGFAPVVNGAVTIVTDDDCSNVKATTLVSLCEPIAVVVPGHGVGYQCLLRLW